MLAYEGVVLCGRWQGFTPRISIMAFLSER